MYIDKLDYSLYLKRKLNRCIYDMEGGELQQVVSRNCIKHTKEKLHQTSFYLTCCELMTLTNLLQQLCGVCNKSVAFSCVACFFDNLINLFSFLNSSSIKSAPRRKKVRCFCSQALCTRILIFLCPQTFCGGFKTLRVHTFCICCIFDRPRVSQIQLFSLSSQL